MYKVIKKSMHLTITVQKSGAQRLFDHSARRRRLHVKCLDVKEQERYMRERSREDKGIQGTVECKKAG
jgi:hypothetical protein